MLVDHANSRRDGIGARAKSPFNSVDQDDTGIRVQHPECNTHQRRLTGTVLTEQRMECSATNGELHIVDGDRRSEPFRDTTER
jgi:hypothetical protein